MIKLQEMVIPENKDKTMMDIETGKGMKQYTVSSKALGLPMSRQRMFTANFPITDPSKLDPEDLCPDPTHPDPKLGLGVRNGWRRNAQGEVVKTDINLFLFGEGWQNGAEFFEIQSDGGVLPTIKATKQPDMWTTSIDPNKQRRRIRIDEGERLFGLEPGHTAAPGLDDDARWARLGEAVVVDVLEYVLRPAVANWAEGELNGFLFRSI